MCSVAHCRAEIAVIEAQIRAGHPDLQGLCLALSDWHAEIRLLQASVGLAPAGARLAHGRSDGGGLACWAHPSGIDATTRKPAAAGAGRAKKKGGVRCYGLIL